jgi:hypothetical protein
MLATGVVDERNGRVEAATPPLATRELHFPASAWSAHGVLMLEAAGEPCAAGVRGDALEGEFSASWNAPEQGCYRIDAHAAGADCGFGADVALTIDSREGRTEKRLEGTSTTGWKPVGVYGFDPKILAGIMQPEGAVDAFRIIQVPRVHETCEMGTPVFGSLTVATNGDSMPQDFASKLYVNQGRSPFPGLGSLLTASIRPYSGQGRRLSSGVKNEIVIDFDTAGSRDVPTKIQIRDAAFEVCNMLEAKECAQHVSFKSDTTGASVEWFSEPEPANPAKEQECILCANGLLAPAVIVGSAVVLIVVVATWLLLGRSEKTPIAPSDSTTFSDRAEKKMDTGDDNASTATPDSTTSGKLDDLDHLDGNSIAEEP